MARADVFRGIAIISAIAAIGAAHYFTPDSLLQLHYLIQRLFYVPVVYAALYYGCRGGLMAAILAAVAYLQQIVATWKLRPSYSINQWAEVALFCVAGILAGLLADRERRQKKTLQETA